MKAIEFIDLHREDDEGCECLILPDGQVEEPKPSHINRLAELTGADTSVLVSPSEPTREQLDTLEELRDAALLAPRYLLEKAGEEYVKSAARARRAIEGTTI